MNALIVLMLAAGLSAGNPERTRTIEHQTAVTPAQRVELRGFRGADMTVKTWDRKEVGVKIIASIESSDKEDEERYLRELTLLEEVQSQRVVLTLKEPKLESSEGFTFRRLITFKFDSFVEKKATVEVFVPKDNPFFTDLRYGSISVENILGALDLDGQSNTVNIRSCANLHEVKNDYGKSTIQNSGGELTLETKSGTVDLDDFNGGLNISADYSTVTVSHVTKSMSLESKSGHHSISTVGGDLMVTSDYSTVSIKDVKGFVGVTDKSGRVKVSNVGGVSVDAPYSSVEIVGVNGTAGRPIRINGQSGQLEVSDATGDLYIDNSYSTNDLSNIKGNVEVKCQSGKIIASRITGDWTSSSPYTSVSVRSLTAQNVTADGKSNGIDLELVSKPTRVQIRNEYGDVTLRMPEGFAGDVRLKSEYGSIKTDLSVEVETMGSGAVAIGKVGTGTGSLRIETKSGSIRVSEK